MIKTLSFCSAALAMLVLSIPTASALTNPEARQCNALGKSLKARQADAKAKAQMRESLLIEVEAAGDAWEEAEELRNFSNEYASKADTTKATYETLKANLLQEELLLQDLVGRMNQDVARYNRTCVKD
ncbi:MAG: hypothetical protein AAGG45_10120 [Pseudomonadota bacterium]